MIDRQVRAFNPWPMAQTQWNGQQLRVWDAEPIESPATPGPGQVLATSAAGIDVGTGHGVLRLTRVQAAGRKAMSAAEFLNAHRLDGAVLGIVSRSAAVRAEAAKIVADVATRGRSLDAVLSFDNAATRQERGLTRALAYDSIRWYLRLDALLERLLARPGQKLDPDVRALAIVDCASCCTGNSGARGRR